MAACQPEIADAKETKIESRALTVVPVDVGRGVLTLDVEQALAQRTPPTAPAREGARACHRSEHPGGGGGEYPSESAQVRGGTRQRSARFCVALQRRGAAWCSGAARGGARTHTSVAARTRRAAPRRRRRRRARPSLLERVGRMVRRARQVEEGRGRRWQQRRQEGAGRGSQDSGGRLARGRPCGDGIVEVWKLLGSGACCHGRGVEVAPRGERAVLCEEAVVVVAQRLQRAHRPLLAAARRQLAAAHLAHLRSRPHGRARRRLVRRAGSLQRACTRGSGCGHRGRALVSSREDEHETPTGAASSPRGGKTGTCGPHLGHLEGGASRGVGRPERRLRRRHPGRRAAQRRRRSLLTAGRVKRRCSRRTGAGGLRCRSARASPCLAGLGRGRQSRSGLPRAPGGGSEKAALCGGREEAGSRRARRGRRTAPEGEIAEM